MTLDSVRFDTDGLHADTHRHHEREPALAGYLDGGAGAAGELARTACAGSRAGGPTGAAFERLRWFWLPGEPAADAVVPVQSYPPSCR